MRRVGECFRVGKGGLLLTAILIGAGAGIGAVGFRWLITSVTTLFTGTSDPTALAGHPVNPRLPWLGPGLRRRGPVVGGLLYGPLVDRFAREARGHGVPEVMYAVGRRGGRIRRSVAVVKALASALCIGSGGSVGREGPIVQIGSALGSSLGQRARMPESRLRMLVACGAAGGIAATFNAPIAGVVLRARAHPAATSRRSPSAWWSSPRWSPRSSGGPPWATRPSCGCRRSPSRTRPSSRCTPSWAWPRRWWGCSSPGSCTGSRTCATGSGAAGVAPPGGRRAAARAAAARAATAVRRRLPGARARRRGRVRLGFLVVLLVGKMLAT